MPSQTFIKAIQALTTDEVFLTLIRITHADIDADAFPNGICIVAHDQNVVSNGIEYIAYPVRIRKPEQGPEELPRAQLTIDNIDPAIINALRLLQGNRPVIEFATVLLSDPDTIEDGPYYFQLMSTPWDRTTITATLGAEPILNETWPAGAMTPATHPGIF